jgi:hypothetical protein
MATTINMLKEKIAHIQQELDEAKAMLDEIATAQTAAKPNPLAGIKFADKEPLRKAFDKMFARMGISHVKFIGAEELQRRMLQSGVKPEDCIGSRGIMRSKV